MMQTQFLFDLSYHEVIYLQHQQLQIIRESSMLGYSAVHNKVCAYALH